MVQMGVLVPTGDMTAVRRTAQFFLARYSLDTKSFISFLLFSKIYVGNLYKGLKVCLLEKKKRKRECPL